MLLGPVPAVTEALKKAGLTINDMDLVEVCDTHCVSRFQDLFVTCMNIQVQQQCRCTLSERGVED